MSSWNSNPRVWYIVCTEDSLKIIKVLPATSTETLVARSSKPLPFTVRTVPPALLPKEGLTSEISTDNKIIMEISSTFKSI